jgi:RNA polymerase sigma-70 factor (ECF subfamily)
MQIAATPPHGGPTEAAWLQFRGRLRAFVSRRVSNPADVDDLLQRVFLKMHASLAGIRSHEGIQAWLYSTARRAVADHYRAGSRLPEVPAGSAVDLDVLRPVPGMPGDGVRHVRQQVASCLAPMLEGLPLADRDAILLTAVQGLRLAEAAGRVGLSVSGMKSRVQRARRRLRKAMLDCCHVPLDALGGPTDCVKRDQAPGPRCR